MDMQVAKARENGDHAGFTLAEMMVVVVIIGLLATLVVPNVLGRLADAQRAKARAEIAVIVSALKEYAMRNAGRFPDDLEALVVPDANGYAHLDAANVPRDPWDHPYEYDPPGIGRPQPRVCSYGRDGQAGGAGIDADLDNWTVSETQGGAR